MIKVPNFNNITISVLGDLMLDRYLFGKSDRISPEAPVPVVNISKTEDRAGGAANVAINLNQLGIQTNLLGLLGDDQEGQNLENILSKAGVRCHLKKIKSTNTTVKTRIQSRGQQLIRFDKDSSNNESIFLDNEINNIIINSNALIVSDYEKGATVGIEKILKFCRKNNVLTLVDPKGLCFKKYKFAGVLTPNENEFEAVVGKCRDENEMLKRSSELISDLQLEAILITRGHKGMLLVTEDGGFNHLQAEARDVYDVTGAGDTVISVLAASIAAGEKIIDAAKLANIAAGIVVGKIGVESVSPSQLKNKINQKKQSGVCSIEEIENISKIAREDGRKIVMTNGCFDILHAGHIKYLEEAKALGDTLIIAINDDESVVRLKGKHRPINPLSDRMKVLDGLASSDFIVPFGEDTPIELINLIKPDILVKGGDYSINDVVGADEVREYGGDVKILSYLDGYSSSKIIEKLKI